MAWTYRNHTSEAEPRDDAPALPAENTAYQAFDALRWARVIGYTEDGGFSSILIPNVCDDCQIIAFAPLNETEDPDEQELGNAWQLGPAYKNPEVPKLLLAK